MSTFANIYPQKQMTYNNKQQDSGLIVQDSIKAWLLAARPKTLSGAAVPVMIGVSAAFSDTLSQGAPFSLTAAMLCFLFAFIMQIDANFVNDYFDFMKGTDNTGKRLGPRRACAQGWVRPGTMKGAIAITTALACMAGLPLIVYDGMEMIIIGLLCVVFCFLYTTSLSYLGLGDVLVLVFFGVVPVCVTYYIQLHTVSPPVLLASLACGLVIDTLLIVNNYRDRDTDREAKKNTLVVRIGEEASRRLYLMAGVAACCINIVFVFSGRPLAFVLPMLYLYLHIKTYKKLCRINRGKALNICLGDTARNMFVYGLTVSAGLLAAI